MIANLFKGDNLQKGVQRIKTDGSENIVVEPVYYGEIRRFSVSGCGKHYRQSKIYD